MKRIMPIIMFSLCILPLMSKADIMWSGAQGLSLTPLDPSYNLDIDSDGAVDFLFRGRLAAVDYKFDPLDGNTGLGTAEVLTASYKPLVDGFIIGPDIVSPYVWEDEERDLLRYANPEGDGFVGGAVFTAPTLFLVLNFRLAMQPTMAGSI